MIEHDLTKPPLVWLESPVNDNLGSFRSLLNPDCADLFAVEQKATPLHFRSGVSSQRNCRSTKRRDSILERALLLD